MTENREILETSQAADQTIYTPSADYYLATDSIALRNTSKYISYILHPFLIPLYAVLLLLFGSTVMGGIPLKLKFYFIALVAINTIAIPAFMILLCRRLGYLNSLSLRTRRDRILPIIIIMICYGICIFAVPEAVVSFLLRKFIIAAFCCVVMAFAVNFLWKISLHLIAMGGLTAMLFILSISGFGLFIWPLVGAIIISGALASARLFLGSHNTVQVLIGYIAGFAVTALVILTM